MDLVIFYRVMSILAELGLNLPVSVVDDFDANFCIRDIGPHRLYSDFHLEVRDDVDTTDLAVAFSESMAAYNKISSVKADFYELNEYPGSAPNWHTVYLTVTTI